MIDNLSYVYNTRDVPLRYVVRKDYMVDVDDITSEEEILYKAIPNIPRYSRNQVTHLNLVLVQISSINLLE